MRAGGRGGWDRAGQTSWQILLLWLPGRSFALINCFGPDLGPNCLQRY